MATNKKSKVVCIVQKDTGLKGDALCFFVGAPPKTIDNQLCVVLGDDGNPVIDEHTGEPRLAFPPVADITKCKDRFGSGAIVDEPCYCITFEGAPVQVIIKDSFVVKTIVHVVDNVPSKSVPELPDAAE